MPKARKDAPAPNPAVKRCIDLFHDRHVARFGFKPDPRQYGRFGKELQLLLGAWGEDVVAGLIREFFETTDPRVLRSDYKPMDFVNLAQRLRLQGQRLDDRTAENLDAAARAIGRRR